MIFFLDAVKQIDKNALLLINPSLEELREMARKGEKTTEFGSPCYITRVRNRSAKFTEIITDEPNEAQKKIISDVVNYLKGKKLIQLDAQMCQNREIALNCRGYFTENYARIPFMWRKSLFVPKNFKKPDMVFVDVPEWPEIKILVDATSNITFALGSDYFGECKKANLRMTMWIMKKKHNGLGLHAGSKIMKVRDKNGTLVEKGFLLFGLSGTGKTTLTVHDHGLKGEEKVTIKQDDVVLMREDGFCYGTEDGFFIKTEGLDENQRVIYNAAISKDAVFENVRVNENGKVDFKNYTLTSNGRGIILRRDIPECIDPVDLPKAHVLIFITRRDDIIPPIAKLTPAQAAAAFMLGESIETSAGDPAKAGQSKREVGTNPFIIGPPHEEGNKILEILRKNPDIEAYTLNTGSVGGKEKGKKITINDSTAIMKEIACGTIEWEKDKDWNCLIAKKIPGIDPKKLNPRNYFSNSEYNALVEKLRAERKAWLAQFPLLRGEISREFT